MSQNTDYRGTKYCGTENLWSEMFIEDPHEILKFRVKHIYKNHFYTLFCFNKV